MEYCKLISKIYTSLHYSLMGLRFAKLKCTWASNLCVTRSLLHHRYCPHQAAIAISFRVLLLCPSMSHVSSEENNAYDDDNDYQDNGNNDADRDSNRHLILVGSHENGIIFGVSRCKERWAELAPAPRCPGPDLKPVLGALQESGNFDHLLLCDDNVAWIGFLVPDEVLDFIEINVEERIWWWQPR